MASSEHKDDDDEGEDKTEKNEAGTVAVPPKVSPKDPKDWCGATYANNTVVSLTPEVPRETWDKKVEFLLAVIGFAVDLGNVWRFPYICLQNGGGAFLIPYCIMLIFGGLPLFYMELALGQFHRCGCLTIWKRICPALKGIGYAICLIDVYMGMYYNTIIGWAVYYFFASFSWELPWTTCDSDWSTPLCAPTNDTSKNDSSLPAKEYYERKVLEMQNGNGLDDMGAIKWELALCVLAVFLLVYFSLWKGVKSTGKAVWVTALAPYVVLFILLARGATLPGAADGIIYYLTPDCSKLLEKKVWIDAASQIFFSLGPGFGTLLALSSYNKFNNNCYRDAILTSSINCLTSFLAGFVIFSGLGYMAHIQNKKIDQLDKEGPGLVFIVYPAAIATMPFSFFWSIIFFLMLITLGLDSTFGGLEAMITALCDEYPKLLGRHREIFVGVLLFFIYICALPTTTYGGAALVDLLNDYGPSISILFVVFVEAAGVFWFYGVNRFSDDIEKMLGFRPGIFWRVCWSYISPLFLLSVCIFSLTASEDTDNLKYPRWSVKIGWILTASSLVCIPLYMAYSIAVTPGNLVQENATKLCTNTGWWVRQDLNVTWTNYTGCYHGTPYVGLPPFNIHLQNSPMVKSYIPIVKLISQIGYGISLIALLLAFTILAFNKRLRCPRNLLHLNLFVSFIMRASMAFLKDNLFVEGVGLRRNVFYLDGELVFTNIHHRWECKMLTALWQYFILANYSWILMEGIYLHNLTFVSMFYDTSSIFWHVTMGWTLPAVFVIPWAAVRAFYEDTFCWTTHTNKFYFYIIKTPIIVSILINLILFINIIRVLLKKLNSTTALFLEPRISRYRKWAKSTLILMPLYGVHYALLLGMSYSNDPTVEIVWLISDQLFGSSQGFCVALLYCILNGEVMNEMSRKWDTLKANFTKWSLGENFFLRSQKAAELHREQSHGQSHITAC